ncbi:ATP-binding cassette domain-containing protein, partial [Saccharothrix hoggarensis]
DADEVAELFRIIRVLRDEGVAVLFVTHFLEQVYEISDRITVLRNGRLVGEHATASLSRIDLVSAMLGREMGLLDEIERRSGKPGETFLLAEGVGRKGSVAPFDLEIRAGEVVGLAGLLGSGRTEVARLLFGADKADSGRVVVGGRQLRLTGPRAGIEAGVAFSSEDRKAEGIVADLSVRDNLILAMQAARGWARPVPRKLADELVAKYIDL